MHWIQEKLEQPSPDTNLIRYMDEWKFKNIIENGLCFTQVAKQKDVFDGTSWTSDGLGRMMNNDYESKEEISTYRQNCYITCWTRQDNPTEEKYLEYCDFEKSPFGYAISVNYKRLIEWVKGNCKIRNNNFICDNYLVNWGKVIYKEKEVMQKKYSQNGDREIETFFKNKLDFEDEDEFRIKLTIANSVNIPKENNYVIQSKAEIVKYIKGNNFRGFISNDIKVYKYNKNTKEIQVFNYKNYSDLLHKLGVLEEGETEISKFVKEYSPKNLDNRDT